VKPANKKKAIGHRKWLSRPERLGLFPCFRDRLVDDAFIQFFGALKREIRLVAY
jgi:hypothetical protein